MPRRRLIGLLVVGVVRVALATGALAQEAQARPSVAIADVAITPGGWTLPPPQLSATIIEMMMGELVASERFHVYDGQWLVPEREAGGPSESRAPARGRDRASHGFHRGRKSHRILDGEQEKEVRRPGADAVPGGRRHAPTGTVASRAGVPHGGCADGRGDRERLSVRGWASGAPRAWLPAGSSVERCRSLRRVRRCDAPGGARRDARRGRQAGRPQRRARPVAAIHFTSRPFSSSAQCCAMTSDAGLVSAASMIRNRPSGATS